MGNIFCPPSAEEVPTTLKSSSFADTDETISLDEAIVLETIEAAANLEGTHDNNNNTDRTRDDNAREIFDDLLNMITFIDDESSKRRKPKQSEQIDWNDFLKRISSLHHDTLREVLQIQDVDNGNETLLLWILYIEGGPPKDIVTYILKIYPNAAKEAKDNDGCTCLHYTIWRNSSDNVTKAIMDAYPQAIVEEDDDGMTPLHWIQANTSSTVIRNIIERDSTAITLKDKDNWTCLHYSIRHNTNTSVIQAIVDAYPQSVLQKNNDDETPLHWIKSTTPLEVIKVMTEKYPKVLLMVDNCGRTPLQCAKEEHAMTEVIDYLTETMQNEKSRILFRSG